MFNTLAWHFLLKTLVDILYLYHLEINVCQLHKDTTRRIKVLKKHSLGDSRQLLFEPCKCLSRHVKHNTHSIVDGRILLQFSIQLYDLRTKLKVNCFAVVKTFEMLYFYSIGSLFATLKLNQNRFCHTIVLTSTREFAVS